MTQHEFKFVASQAADTIYYRGDPTKFEVGDAAWWSMPSYKAKSDTRLDSLTPDGGSWRGMIHVLPDGSYKYAGDLVPGRGEF